MARLDSLPEPEGGWAEALPMWAGAGSTRGLQCWGSRVYKKHKNAPRAWEVDLCAGGIQGAITWYVQTYICTCSIYSVLISEVRAGFGLKILSFSCCCRNLLLRKLNNDLDITESGGTNGQEQCKLLRCERPN